MGKTTLERTPAQIKLRKLTCALANAPMIDYEVADLLCAALPTARLYLRLLHRRGEIHVSGWVRTRLDGEKDVLRKKWKLGPGQDAPKPARMTSFENNKRFRKRLRQDPERHEARKAADRARKHRKHFKPHPDVAASWIPRREA